MESNWLSGVSRRFSMSVLVVGSLLAVFSALDANASPQYLDPVDSGWYRSRPSGIDHISTNRNFLVGDLTDGTTYRNFFVFDLSGVVGPITSATFTALVSDNLGVTNPAGTFETWTLFDVTTGISVVTAGSSPTTTYQDLGSGTILGSMSFSTADRGRPVGFDFNAAGLAQLNSAIGGQWAFGGAVTTLDDPARSESIFHASGLDSLARLSINVPEPSTLLAAVGLPLLFRRLR